MRWRGIHSFMGTAIKAAMLCAVALFYVYNGAILGLGSKNNRLRVHGVTNSTGHHAHSVAASHNAAHNTSAMHKSNHDAASSSSTTDPHRYSNQSSREKVVKPRPPPPASASSDPHWPFMRRMMCPDKTPNSNVWSVLFEQARTELGFPKENITAHPSELIAQDSFFKFNYGGVGYASSPYYTLYLRIFKAGNDQIRHNLHDLLYDSGGYFEQWSDLSILFAKSLSLLNTDPENMCVVTAVRDPVEHFLSAYNEIEFRVEGRKRAGGDMTLPKYTQHENGTTARFEQFVNDFIGGPRSAGLFGGYARWGIQEITHIFSMTGVLWGLKRLKDCYGVENMPNLTAYLPSLNNLDTEFPKFIHETCPHIPPFDAFKKRVVHDSQFDEYNFYQAAKRSWEDEGGLARALCAIHALDYACYDEIPVPPVCASVFSTDDFRKKIAFAARRPKATLAHCGKGSFP